MRSRLAQLFALLVFASIVCCGPSLCMAGGQDESGIAVEVVSSSQYGQGTCGLIGCKGGAQYVLRSSNSMYFLSCRKEVTWDKCPILASGDRFRLTIDAKDHVLLTGSRAGKPFKVQLDYDKSEQLPPGATTAASSNADEAGRQPELSRVTDSGDTSISPLSDSGNAFLEHCETHADTVTTSACKIWVDAFMNGLVTGMAAATPGEAEFNPEKNEIICFTKTSTYGDVFPLILKYIRDHPAERNDPTAALAFAALQEAFPCK